MAIAITLKEYLNNQELDYTVLKHTHTSASKETARAAHIPDQLLAKSVMLEDENGRYLLAVLPSNYHVNLAKLHNRYDVHLGLASEDEVGSMFSDCELGAVPPIGQEYGIDVIMDNSLVDCPDVYFEAGDHKHLIHMNGMQFKQLMEGAAKSSFAKPD